MDKIKKNLGQYINQMIDLLISVRFIITINSKDLKVSLS